jgi:hypothetical protein
MLTFVNIRGLIAANEAAQAPRFVAECSVSTALCCRLLPNPRRALISGARRAGKAKPVHDVKERVGIISLTPEPVKAAGRLAQIGGRLRQGLGRVTGRARYAVAVKVNKIGPLALYLPNCFK